MMMQESRNTEHRTLNVGHQMFTLTPALSHPMGEGDVIHVLDRK
jgi:hypothetical protein